MAAPPSISVDHDRYQGRFVRNTNWGIFKNDFRRPPHTSRQAEMAIQFMHCLGRCVAEAVNIVEERINHPNRQLFLEDSQIARVQAFRAKLARLRELKTRGSMREDDRNCLRTFAAAYGSMVELETYHIIPRYWKVKENEPGDYMLEIPEPGRYVEGTKEGLFPHSFVGRGAKKGSRPDVRLALGGGFEALYDITSEAQEGHIFDKGANASGGGWLARGKIPFVAEIYHPGRSSPD